MKIAEIIAPPSQQRTFLEDVRALIPEGHSAVRCVFDDQKLSLGVIPESLGVDICDFQKRAYEDFTEFNCALVIPTGMGASVGGHAGDATPVLRMLSEVCDQVFTHPNVVNASDLNEQPHNAHYIEGSILSRFLMGTIGLQPARKNRILVLVGSHEEQVYEIAAINAVNAARATYGVEAVDVVKFDDCCMRVEICDHGRASGVVENVTELRDILASRDDYDAVAVTSVIKTDPEIRDLYYQSDGDHVNPWGGIEALLTHWISCFTDKPSAHAPMMESSGVENIDYGVIDPRMSAEIISISYFQCVLKGLQTAPRIVRDLSPRKDVLTASNVNALVIPAGCLGIPVLAAMKQGIPVIAVRDDMQSKTCLELIRELPWAAGQYVEADNYLEAAGYLATLRAGLSLESVMRPIPKVHTSGFQYDTSLAEKMVRTEDNMRHTQNGQGAMALNGSGANAQTNGAGAKNGDASNGVCSNGFHAQSSDSSSAEPPSED